VSFFKKVTLLSRKSFTRIVCVVSLLLHVLCRRIARWFVFKPKILGNLGKILRASDWKILIYFMAIHMEYFMAIWDMLLPFGTFCVRLEHFFPFWYHTPRKIWQPCCAEPRTTVVIKCRTNFSSK
jgi:hypothetical protein